MYPYDKNIILLVSLDKRNKYCRTVKCLHIVSRFIFEVTESDLSFLKDSNETISLLEEKKKKELVMTL